MAKKSGKDLIQETVIEKTFTVMEYCNIIGAIHGVQFVASMKFSKLENKTISEWDKLFKEENII